MRLAKAPIALAAALALAVAAWAGYALYLQFVERAERRAAEALVGDATARLRSGLRGPASGLHEAIEEQLGRTRAWRNRDLAAATEHYLVSVREILRRQQDAERFSRQAAASRAALAVHMRLSARRDSAWLRSAAQIKKVVERDHFDLDMQLGALAHLLETFPDAVSRIAPHVGGSPLLDEAARHEAHRQALAAAQYASGELEKVRQLR